MERKTAAEWNAYFSALLGVGSLVFDPPPNPYRTAMVARRAQATDDPAYQPFGTPPNSYAIARAAKEHQR